MSPTQRVQIIDRPYLRSRTSACGAVQPATAMDRKFDDARTHGAPAWFRSRVAFVLGGETIGEINLCAPPQGRAFALQPAFDSGPYRPYGGHRRGRKGRAGAERRKPPRKPPAHARGGRNGRPDARLIAPVPPDDAPVRSASPPDHSVAARSMAVVTSTKRLPMAFRAEYRTISSITRPRWCCRALRWCHAANRIADAGRGAGQCTAAVRRPTSVRESWFKPVTLTHGGAIRPRARLQRHQPRPRSVSSGVADIFPAPVHCGDQVERLKHDAP